MDLDSFAKDNPPPKGGRKCSICLLSPEVRTTIASHKGLLPATTILAWLRDDQGHEDMTRSKVERHIREHVK